MTAFEERALPANPKQYRREVKKVVKAAKKKAANRRIREECGRQIMELMAALVLYPARTPAMRWWEEWSPSVFFVPGMRKVPRSQRCG